MTNATNRNDATTALPAERPGPDEAWPFYAEDEIEAAAAVLRSGQVNQWTGPHVFAFQKACTERFGGGHGIALANGSLALELALRAFGISHGDEVIVTPRSFVASAFTAMLTGATPVFADVDRDSGNITPDTIARVITDRTRAIVPVHLAGWPADMPGIMGLADRHGLKVIEDCAQAQGAAIDGRSVGSFGDAAAFSFCQDKIISTGGEGGYLSLRDESAWKWAWSFKDHGKNWDKVNMPAVHSGMFRWLHDDVGTNWRLTGPQAAIGLRQLGKLEEWTRLRTRNASIWAAALGRVDGLRVPMPTSGVAHAYYKFYFYLDLPREQAASARSESLSRASEAGLRLFSGSCSEMYLEDAFRDLPRPDCPIAREMTDTSLMVEVHPTLRPELLEQRAGRLAAICAEVLR
ncbi:MAG TPA: DegT/DnrJ/EryC1/StrS family aminotransferase [Allosphingosinicella sp.]|nr:DegT/DnrJ/EryC1/StrS family aminotransferase [Allosphingosinicella sp.]